MRCIDCKYFTKSTYHPLDNRFGDCNKDGNSIGYYSNYDDKDDRFMIIEGDEGWGFRVGINFGCIHFESKEIL